MAACHHAGEARWVPAAPARLGLPALCRPLPALLGPMFDDRVRARKHQAGMAIVETDQIGRFPARSANLDDLARPLGLAHDVATHAEPVSDGCLHQPTSSPALSAPPVHRGDTLTGVPHHYGQYPPHAVGCCRPRAGPVGWWAR